MLAMMWVGQIGGNSVTQGLAVLSLAVTFGLALGAIRIKGLRLGISGVLFSALLMGQLGELDPARLRVEPHVLEFLRDFALILFVYALGLQVGPGFAASLRQEGLRLNVLSLGVVILGAVMTAGVIRAVHFPPSAASGLYAGAYTTTPGLAAGQEALRHARGAPPDAATRAGLAYTVTYPFGVVGPILVIVLLRRFFRVNLARELEDLAAEERVRRPPIEGADFEVTAGEHVGRVLRDQPTLRGKGVVFSRLLRGDTVTVPTGETQVQLGDVLHAVGPRTALAQIVSAMGRPIDGSPSRNHGAVRREDVVVTRTQVLRRSLRELDLIRRTGVTVARVNRAGIDLVPNADLRLVFGDRVTIVGPETGLKMIEAEVGNCPETLNRPQLVPIFLGIVLGILVGSIPFYIPGLHTTIRIGLAGGPMIVAILLSQFGNIGSVVWYMPVGANSLFRDFGLAVFLACVGLQSGDHFVQNLVHSGGVGLVAWGAAITILPVLLVGLYARWVLKMNFIKLAGWVAGAMTSIPALMFANELAGNDTPATIYAAVAPLALLVPILCAQFLVILLM
ncbi:MAG TPA: putative transporter [Tepidisphaeraceae bacterium]|nr:putative transporter [Tepidisphaeraceae bacterium]